MQDDLNKMQTIYKKRYDKFGVSPQSLGWTKGKQDIRFDVLLSGLSCDQASFLDVGCGFGDLNKALEKRTMRYDYLGLDIVEEFLNKGSDIYGNDNRGFVNGDFLSMTFDQHFDHIIASGIFAFTLTDMDNYDYIKKMLTKMFSLCTQSVSVDFLSNQVNFEREGNFYTSPAKVLEIAFELTRNVSIRHDYMPFEFSLRLNKDDSFNDDDTVFNHYNRSD